MRRVRLVVLLALAASFSSELALAAPRRGSGATTRASSARPAPRKPARAAPKSAPKATSTKPSSAKPSSKPAASEPAAREADGAAPARPAPNAASEAQVAPGTPAPSANVVKTVEEEQGVKTYTFGAEEVEGRLRSPQILYFLRRVRAEFAAEPLGHRSFLLELADTRRDPSLQ